MSDPGTLAVLNQSFVRVYRSFGQYMQEAWPTFDVGEATIKSIIDRQATDAERLGKYLIGEQGTLYTGNYSLDFGDLHFLNSSRLLADWTIAQEQLVADLEADRARITTEDPGTQILEGIISNEKDHLAQLSELRAARTAT